MLKRAEILHVHQRAHAANGIGRGQAVAQPAAPEPAGSRLFQGVQAAQPGQEHHDGRTQHHSRANARSATMVANGVQPGFPPQDRVSVIQDTAKNIRPA